ncbi:MAG: ankyrin repeat domain-containing protein [bacterium]|nr:ankyrin repeat domain-containing protein [bacterium]
MSARRILKNLVIALLVLAPIISGCGSSTLFIKSNLEDVPSRQEKLYLDVDLVLDDTWTNYEFDVTGDFNPHVIFGAALKECADKIAETCFTTTLDCPQASIDLPAPKITLTPSIVLVNHSSPSMPVWVDVEFSLSTRWSFQAENGYKFWTTRTQGEGVSNHGNLFTFNGNLTKRSEAAIKDLYENTVRGFLNEPLLYQYSLFAPLFHSERGQAVSIAEDILNHTESCEINRFAMGQLLQIAAMSNDHGLLSLFLSRDPDVKVLLEDLDYTPLTYALQSGYFDIANALLDYGADIYHVDSSGQTPLFHQAQAMNLDAVRLLLERGAEFAPVDTCAYSALASGLCYFSQGELQSNSKESDSGRNAFRNAAQSFESASSQFLEIAERIESRIPEASTEAELNAILQSMSPTHSSGLVNNPTSLEMEFHSIALRETFEQNAGLEGYLDSVQKMEGTLHTDSENHEFFSRAEVYRIKRDYLASLENNAISKEDLSQLLEIISGLSRLCSEAALDLKTNF